MAFVLYLVLATVSLTMDLVRPYRVYRDHRARELAAWFWESFSLNAELACAREDLGLVTDPRHGDMHLTEYYVCYREIYSERHRQNRPIRLDRISEHHPLRCVFFNESPEGSPVFQAWLARMKETFVCRGSHEYASYGFGPRGLDFINRYVVYEFVPQPGRVELSIP